MASLAHKIRSLHRKAKAFGLLDPIYEIIGLVGGNDGDWIEGEPWTGQTFDILEGLIEERDFEAESRIDGTC